MINKISSEVKSCFSGGCDPVMILNKTARNTARSTAEGFAEPIKQEFNEAMDDLFSNKLNPLADKFDYIAQKRISQSQDAVKDVVKNTVSQFSDLKDEVKDDVDNLINSVDEKYKDNLKLTFTEINQARAEAILGLRAMIGDVDTSLENRINQVSITMMTALRDAKQMSDKFTPEAFRKKLLDPAFDRIDDLEKDFFQDLNGLLDKLTGMSDAAIEDTKKKFFGILEGFVEEPCKTSIGVEGLGKLRVNLDDMQRYRYEECLKLEDIQKFINTNNSVNLIRDSYIQLEINAARMNIRAKGLGILELQLICVKDWVKYGQSSKFWSQHRY